MLKIVSLNINGIRSGANKGFFAWLEKENPDIVCLQEVRAHNHQLEEKLFHPNGYFCHYVEAEKKGYSGVAIYSKVKPENITTKLNHNLALKEGRFLQFDFTNFIVVSLYMPSGTTGDVRQDCKYEFMYFFETYLQEMLKQEKEIILCGDWNIAHKKIDIKNWKSNEKNSGFLPAERAWLDKVFDQFGYFDAFRVVNKEEGQYTWWSNRGRAYTNNVGWRIDYQIISPALKDKVKKAWIYKDERFSDHAPLIIEYDL